MLKKFLCILLTLLLLVGYSSCSDPIFESSENDGLKQTEGENVNSDNSNNQNNTTQKPDNSSKPNNEALDKSSFIPIAGDTPYKIIYGNGYSEQANTLLGFLKSFDKATPYTASADTESENTTPEILLGLTNREESVKAKSELETYLDFSISVTDKKIIIFANTAERLDAAIEYFVSQLTYNNEGLLSYPTAEPYVKNYNKYTYKNLSIAGEAIKTFSIIIPEKATDKEKKAANDIAEWIALNSGQVLAVVTDTTPPTDNEIIIGKASRTECAEYSADAAEKIFHSLTLKNKKLLIFAGNTGSYDTAIKVLTNSIKSDKGALTSLNIKEEASSFSGKKAIFIGNSFIYWGGCVTFITNDDANDAIRAAGGDKGYFNEVCKANNITIDVYNYTYGGKNLDWIYSNKLLELPNEFLNDIDYVFISEAGQNSSSFKNSVTRVASLFKNAEEIVYLAHANTFSSEASYIINALPELAQKGYKIVAWGELVYDVYKGTVAVPNATLTYNKNTFIKNASGSEKMDQNAAVISISGYGDDFHQNPLSGYITAQMCFSAITGASAIGQKYEFCWDKTIAPQYDLENFLTYQYGKGQTSNFIEVFNSKPDMLGLQTLMDQYMKKYN